MTAPWLVGVADATGAGPWIPAVTTEPLPGPAWLFSFLLMTVFAVHIALVNAVVGGTVIATAHLAVPGRDKRGRRFATILWPYLAWAMALLVSFGVATLLFVQVLYGRAFFTATGLIGPWWGGIVAAVLLLYILVYAGKGTVIRRPGIAGAFGAGIVVLAAGVMFVQVTAHLLQLRVDLWADLAAGWSGGAGTGSGSLAGRTAPAVGAAIADPTWSWRIAHYVFGTLAFGGVLAGVAAGGPGFRGGDPVMARWGARTGFRWAIAGIVGEMATGPMLLLRQPRAVLAALLDVELPYLYPLALGIGAGIVVLAILAGIRDPIAEPARIRWAMVASVAGLVLMVMTRHGIRLLQWRVAPGVVDSAVRTQAVTASLFVVCAVAGAGVMVWIATRAMPRAASAAGEERSP